jgi:hypothetical protein
MKYLSILMVVFITGCNGYTSRAYLLRQLKPRLEMWADVLHLHYQMTGHQAASLEEAIVAVSMVPGSNADKIVADQTAMIDPWGTRYQFKYIENTNNTINIVITSAGPNRIFNSSDDFVLQATFKRPTVAIRRYEQTQKRSENAAPAP